MKRWKVLAIVVLLTFFLGIHLTSANFGKIPLGNTNAPKEQNCTVCHNTFGFNSGDGLISVERLPREYMPGETYMAEVIMRDPNAARWGFQLTVLDNDGQRVGTLRVLDPVITEMDRTNIAGQAREYISSTLAGSFSDQRNSVSWRFEWTAPDRNVGGVNFYVTGVAANLDGKVTGDRVYGSATLVRMFEPRPPTINFVTPNQGPEAGGTMLMVRGTNFRNGLKATFDKISAVTNFIDETTATVITPPHKAGTVDIVLANEDGMSVTLPAGFTYLSPPPPPPRVLFTSPERGTTTGGMMVRVVGEGFRTGAKVIWDGKELATTYIDINTLMVRSPLHNPGTIPVAVMNPDGQIVELKPAYTYEGQVPLPIVKLLSLTGNETLSAGGEPVTIRWSIESNGTPIQRLLLSTDGGNSFPIILARNLKADISRFTWSITENLNSDHVRLRLEVAQLEGTVRDESKKDFKIVSAPVINSVSPGTTQVSSSKIDLELAGEGFVNGAIVEMNGVKLKATLVSPRLIRLRKVPRNVPGVYTITVRNPNGGVSYSFLFSVAE